MGNCTSLSSPGAALTHAALAGDFEAVSRILTTSPRAVLHQSWSGRTPLLAAAEAGSPIALALLVACLGHLDRVAATEYLNHADRQGDTAVVAASRQGHWECVQLLLEEGATPLPANKSGESALHAACRGGQASAAQALLSARVPTPSGGLTSAATVFVRDRLGDEKWIDAHSRAGLAALHLAVLSGSPETVAVLAERHGAALDNPVIRGMALAPQRCAGSTPLHLAAYAGDIQVVMVLLRAQTRHPGLDLRRLRNARGMTPLSCALIAGQQDAARVLLERGPLSRTIILPMDWALLDRPLREGLKNRYLGVLNRTQLLLQLRDMARSRGGAAESSEFSGADEEALAQLLRRQVVPLWEVVHGLEATLGEQGSSGSGATDRQPGVLIRELERGDFAVGGDSSVGSARRQHSHGATQRALGLGTGGVDWSMALRGSHLGAFSPLLIGSSRRRRRDRRDGPAGAGSLARRTSAEQARQLLAEYMRVLTAGGNAAASSAAPAPAAGAGGESPREKSGPAASPTCAICMDAAVQVALAPCGHEVCFSCACQLCAQQDAAASPRCAFCRGPILGVSPCGGPALT